jgi:hypothetical protein
MRYFTLIVIALFIAVKSIYAQVPATGSDFKLSPDTATVFFVNIEQRWPGSSIQKMNDTLLTGFQFFDPIIGKTSLNAVNGNIGLAYKSLVFDPSPEIGFRFAPSVVNYYLLRNDNIRYYQSFAPYSNVAYSFGAGKEQLFSVTHSQNIARGLSLGVDMRIINSIGNYLRQKSDNSSVAFQGQFITDNQRYAALFNYRSNRYKWRENGGIKYDSLFTENLEPERNRISINLESAENLIKESGVFIQQYYYFGRNPRKAEVIVDEAETTLIFENKEEVVGEADTTFISVNKEVVGEADTTLISKKKVNIPVSKAELPGRLFYNPERSDFLRHTFTYTRNAILYTDGNPRSGFYPEIFIDSVKTFDSIFHHEFSNEFVFEGGIGRARGSGKAVLLRAGIEHTFGIYKNGFNKDKNDSISRKFNRITTFAYLSANAFGVAKAEGKVWVTNGAPFNGDKGISAMLTLPAFDNSTSWGNLTASLGVNALQPDYIFQYHYSNHFSWENSFGQQTILSGKVMYARKFLKAGFNFYTLDGYVYFDQNAKPVRENAAFSVSQLYGLAEIKLGHFDIHAFATWQNVTNTEVLRVPDLAGRVSAYYSVALFKRALYLQTGLSLMYNTAFYGDAYMPALRSYYVQNEVKTGSYPYIDGFINFRVKRARMFLVMKHLNSGFSGYNYMMVPSYPMADRGLRFGVSWNFFD